MWTELIFLHLLVLQCTVSSSPPSPINVIFSSLNLKNLLEWVPGNDTPVDILFTVQYAIYGESITDSRGRRGHWRALRHCTDISQRWCDLSTETEDLENRYFARVRAVSGRASSKWTLATRFDPKSDTSFGPPLVSLETEDNSATITLKGPMRYQPNIHSPGVSMATLYPQMMYNLSIHNVGRGHMNHFAVVYSPYKYRLLDYSTEYCFSAKAKFLSMPVQCQSSAWQCITTPADPATVQLQKEVVAIAVTSVCLLALVVAGYLLHQYLTGKGHKRPYMLNPPSFNLATQIFPPEEPKVFLITVINPSDIKEDISDPISLKQQANGAEPPPGYALQRPETAPEPEDPGDDTSAEYGFVSAGMDLREEEERQGSSKGGGDGSNMKRGGRGFFASHPACSHVNSVPLTQPQGTTNGDVNRWEDTEFRFTNKKPQNDISDILLPTQTLCRGEMGEEMEGKMRIVEEGSERERVPLLSASASWNIKSMSTSDADQTDFLPDNYGVLGLTTANNIERADEEEEEEKDEEEEEGPIFIDWDPKSRKIVFPESVAECSKEEGLNTLVRGERGREGGAGEEEEEVRVMRKMLTLDDVFVRQVSEEEAEAQREREKGGEVWSEADDILMNWDLVVSME